MLRPVAVLQQQAYKDIYRQPTPTMESANPPHIIFAVSYLDMHFTSIKTLIPNKKLCMDFLISSTAKHNQFLKVNPLTPSR